MKMISFVKTWWTLSLVMIVCGCERDIAGSFEVTDARILSRDEVRTAMGRDWARRLSEMPMPPTVVFVGLASNSDLAQYIKEKRSSLSVEAYVCEPERRQLKIVAPMVYSGEKDVTARKIDSENSVLVDGMYRYKMALWTDGSEDQMQDGLEKHWHMG